MTGSHGIDGMAVVVPARDEEDLLPGCLDALRAAVRAVTVPVVVVVVLDACLDRTAEVVAGRPDVEVVGSTAGRAGAARAAGVTHALRCYSAAGRADPARVWLASTDADSLVPPDWLADQLVLADAGADLVLGTVDLPGDVAEDRSAQAWRTAYARGLLPTGDHVHVHGANLGVRASTYLRAGGWPRLPAHEDVGLVHAVLALPDVTVVRTITTPVVTSARLVGRAPQGVSTDLQSLSAM